MRLESLSLPVALVLLACATGGSAPVPQAGRAEMVSQRDDWCEESRYRGDDEGFCEVREWTLAADRDAIEVDASPNGSVRVRGWERNEIRLQAKVQGRARSEGEARDIVRAVEIRTDGREIRADGPRTGRHEGWWVSYRLSVPDRSNLDLQSTNGGIAIEDVSGDIEFRTTNGGIDLSEVEGDVRGRTTNGSVKVELTGSAWAGRGLDVETTNGSVKLWVPADYSAHLETGTTNGSMTVDFPITVRGRIDRRLSLDLGGGGRTIRAYTTNGSVKIYRR